jgi:hypothetical protein
MDGGLPRFLLTQHGKTLQCTLIKVNQRLYLKAEGPYSSDKGLY